MRIILAMVVLVVGVGRGLAAELAETKKTDAAVEQALKYLQSKQQEDGSWGKDRSYRVAVTALCVLSFLSAGHEPNQGPYGIGIDKGMRYLLAMQGKEGVFAPNETHEMYQQGIASWMLAELLRKADKEQAPALKAALERAIEVLVKAQTKDGQMKGGWRYRARYPFDGDMSVTGWQMTALFAARKAGVEVPRKTVDEGLEFIRRCHEPRTGAFCYRPASRTTFACTAAGVIALALEDKEGVKSETVDKAVRYIVLKGPGPDAYHYYSSYRTSHAVFLHNGERTDAFHKQVREKLLSDQQKDGRWIGREATEARVGNEYCTALTVLTLTIERQKLVVHQRPEKKE